MAKRLTRRARKVPQTTTLRFFGSVLPRGVLLGIGPIKFEYFDSQRTRQVNYHLSIEKSLVTVVCECPAFLEGDQHLLFTHAVDFSKACVNVLAFFYGYGLHVVMEKYQVDDGNVFDILLSDAALPPITTSFRLPQEAPAATRLIAGDPAIFMAIDDLIYGLSVPHAAVINSYRAVESVRHMLASPGDTARAAWARLRSKLNIDEPYIRYLSNAAKGWRHGDREYIDANTSQEVHRRAWRIMDRFLVLKRRGIEQLPLEEFSVLQG